MALDEASRARIAPYVSSLTDDVFALSGLPEEVIAVLFAYYSRSRDDLRTNLARLLETDGAMRAADQARGQGRGEEFDQVGAVHAERGIPTGRVGHLDRSDGCAVVTEVMRLGADPRAPFFHRGAEADALQLTHAVGREIDAGPDLAERRRLLVHRHFQAVRDQGIGGEQAADATAHDRDARSSVCHPGPQSRPLARRLSRG